MNLLLRIATALTIIGGLNWGLIGLFDFNLVTAIFGEDTPATRAVYVIVGIAAVVTLAVLFQPQRKQVEVN